MRRTTHQIQKLGRMNLSRWEKWDTPHLNVTAWFFAKPRRNTGGEESRSVWSGEAASGSQIAVAVQSALDQPDPPVAIAGRLGVKWG